MLAIINSLHTGGAEMNLIRGARELKTHGIEVTVLPLKDGGELREMALQQGVDVLSAGARSVFGAWSRSWPLVEGWMYGGALVASLFHAKGSRVVWNFRHVPIDLGAESRTTRAILKVLPHLPAPAAIHVNATMAIDAHRRLGIAADYRFIPNGIDTNHFRFDAAAAANFRKLASVAEDDGLVVHVARRHVHKGQAVLLQAMRLLQARGRKAVVVFVGEGTEALAGDAATTGMDPRACRFLGVQSNTVGAFSAADVVVNPSLTEGSPTVVAEAMSCSAMCVATDVGETAEVIGSTGRVVPPGDPVALADAIETALAMSPQARREAGAAARERIVSRFALATTVERHAASLRQACRSR